MRSANSWMVSVSPYDVSAPPIQHFVKASPAASRRNSPNIRIAKLHCSICSTFQLAMASNLESQRLLRPPGSYETRDFSKVPYKSSLPSHYLRQLWGIARFYGDAIGFWVAQGSTNEALRFWSYCTELLVYSASGMVLHCASWTSEHKKGQMQGNIMYPLQSCEICSVEKSFGMLKWSGYMESLIMPENILYALVRFRQSFYSPFLSPSSSTEHEVRHGLLRKYVSI